MIPYDARIQGTRFEIARCISRFFFARLYELNWHNVRVQSPNSKQLAITPQRWQRIQELFERAIALDAEARANLLLQECADDPSLREQVMALLLASGDDRGELEQRVDRAFAGTAANVEAGNIVGRYRILRTLGRGGMGVVYLAERADDHYQQHVALKVMSRSLLQGEPAGRFRAERQILARLAHPNIARLLDGGQTEDGTPFLVMEHVQGSRIDEYCVKSHLSTRARLQLIQQVCAGVQYAHQNLIVHRDLKPSNILVTTEGVPKLLDFGIAKLLDPTNAGATIPITRGRDRVLTPEHASPEQLRGEPVGTVSDVYSLGVLLYEVLSGRRPFDLSGRSIAEMEHIICETTPRAPSASVSQALEAAGGTSHALVQARELRGDIDNIVLKAMHRDPERRYPSAAALSQDIQNYLDGRPIRARADTWLYRARKFLRRNAVAVSGAMAAGVLIATLVVFYTIRLATERDTAERERQTATTVAEFMTDVFRRANPNETAGKTVTVREALDAAARRIDSDLADQPRLRLTLMRNMSQAYNGLGLWQEARNIMERAVAQERATFGNGGIELARSIELLASVYNNLSQFDAAAKQFEEALAIRRSLGPESEPETILLLNSIAINLKSRQKFAEAIARHRHAEALARRLSPPNDALLGQVLVATAATYSEAGDQRTSEIYAREALPLVRGLVVEGHDMYANVLATLGTTLRRQFKLVEAEKVHREFVTRQTRLLGADHLLVGRAQNNFANLLRAKGDYAAAEQALNEAMRIFRLQSEEDTLDLGISDHNLGALYHDTGQLRKSLEYLGHAIEMKRKATGARSPQVVSSLLERAAVLREMGRLDEARVSFNEATSIATEKFDRNDRRHALLLLEQGRLELATGATADAERDLAEAIARLRGQDDPAKLAEAMASLGDALLAAGKAGEASQVLTESLEIRRKVLPPGHKAIADGESRLAKARQQPAS